MRQFISMAVLLGAVVLLLGGCAKAFTPESQASLKPGMNKGQVEALMGKPMSHEIKPGGIEHWIYDRHDPISSRFERIELRFENGLYKDMTKSSPHND